jgi:hypothetical protein
MAVNPLDIGIDQAAPVDPGLFDGQLPVDGPSAPPAQTLDAAPDPEEVQVAGVGSIGAKILRRVLKGTDEPPVQGLKDVPLPGTTAGQVGDYVVVREATPEEVIEFGSLTGKTSGAPSPTTAQRAAGIPVAEFNLEKIDGSDALKATIDNVSEMWRDAASAAGRGKMTWAETRQLADDMGLERTIQRLMRREGGETFNAEQITASLQAIATSAMELNRLAKIAANSTDTRDLLKFRQHLALHSALQTSMKGAQMEAARALGAFRIPRGVGQDIDTKSLQALMEQFGGENSVRDMAQAYMALPSQAQRNSFSLGAWDKIKGTWFEIWINGLLSAPSTHMANITGNAGFQLLFQMPERFGAGLIGMARRAMGSTAERVYLQESLSDIVGMVQGIGDGWRLAGQAWRTEAPVRDVAAKIETGQRRMITGANLAPNWPASAQRWVDYLGAGIRAPGRALMTADEFFKAVAYRRELNSLATRRALEMTENGHSTDDIAEAMDDIFTGRDTGIATQSEEFAQVATFTNPVEGALGKLGAAIQGTLIGRMLLPFFKTPVNIFKAAADRSPYGFVRAIAAAKDPIKRDILIARASLGTATMAYAAYEYMNGNITGTGPSDYVMRNQLESIGWKKWSFVFVKEGVENPRWLQVGHMQILHPDDVDYVSYAKLEPASMVLAVAADVAERFRYPTATQEEIDAIVMSAADTVFDYMKDQTFMKSFANISGMIAGRKDVSGVVQDLIGSQVPFSSLLASIERVMDPTMRSIIPNRNEPIGLRDLYAGLQKLDDRVPFTASGGLRLLDRFGRDRFSKGANIRSVLLPPFMADIMGDSIEDIEADPVMLAVVAAGVPLTMPPRKIEQVPLTVTEYDTFVKLAANPPGEVSFYNALAGLVSQEDFKEASIPDRQTLLMELDSVYKKVAKELILLHPDYEKQFADLREKVERNQSLLREFGKQRQ